MKIAISLNEVLRDFLSQLEYTYNKYMDKLDLNETPVTNFDLIDVFNKFKTVTELNNFLYNEASLEVFGHADQSYDGLMVDFNNFLLDIKDDEQHTVEIVSREYNKSIPATFFFLSKLGCRIENIRFVQNNSDEWGDADVLVTANPIALNNKPDGKLSVKIKSPYNSDVDGDYELEDIKKFLKDENYRNNILNTTITTYEQI